MTITLEEMRKLEKSATAGPWEYEPERYSALCVIGIKPRDDRWLAHCQPMLNGEANGQLIVSSRNLLPLLLDLWQAIKDHGLVHEPTCMKQGVSVAPCTCSQHDLWEAARALE